MTDIPLMPEKTDVEQATAQTYEAPKFEVKPQSTVQHQMTGLLSQDSDYMKLARNQGLAAANQRGLLNSSIAVGASQAEALKAAFPIASQDATTYGQGQLAGYQAQNQALGQNAQLGTEVGLSNAQAINQLLQQKADNAAAQQQARQAAGLETGLLETKTGLEEQLRAADFGRSKEMASIDTANKERLMQSDADIRQRLMVSEQENAVQLESLRQNYEVMKNLDTTMGALYDGALRSMSNILANEELSTAQSTSAIKTVIDNLGAGLEFISGVNSSGVGGSGGSPSGTGASGQSTSSYIDQQIAADQAAKAAAAKAAADKKKYPIWGDFTQAEYNALSWEAKNEMRERSLRVRAGGSRVD